ncbi:hypothetical protein BDR03DRAFT_413809 [Suillus americanus]|nr:hypothetical protein BDR03DRAFT_413809 [Suillus americanus]
MLSRHLSVIKYMRVCMYVTALMSMFYCIMNSSICRQYDAKSFMNAGLTSDPWANPLRKQVGE